MAEGRKAARQLVITARPRHRRRWAVAAGIAVCWVVLTAVTGSALGATVLAVLLAGLAVVCVLGLRAFGVTRDHPWVRQLGSRPWRDGQDVLQLALRHLPEVFVITPSGSLLAPNPVELQLNPDDLRALCERMDIDLIDMSAAEVYEEQVEAHSARLAGPGRADVRVLASPSVPPGRYRLRQGQPVHEPGPALARPAQPVVAAERELAYAGSHPGRAEEAPQAPGYPNFSAHDGNTRAESGHVPGGDPTALEQTSPRPVPTLRLVTGDSVVLTTQSPARAGRGDVELALPPVPTVSREHARFTFSSGQWWVSNLGRNGITVNGAPLAGERPLSTGDLIRWGTRPDALQSWVEVT
jgi:hypothetical protein